MATKHITLYLKFLDIWKPPTLKDMKDENEIQNDDTYECKVIVSLHTRSEHMNGSTLNALWAFQGSKLWGYKLTIPPWNKFLINTPNYNIPVPFI